MSKISKAQWVLVGILLLGTFFVSSLSGGQLIRELRMLAWAKTNSNSSSFHFPKIGQEVASIEHEEYKEVTPLKKASG